ncbi:hypothetical protein LU293_00770 [Moraxella nasovis]|uniref:hypothetical protein n=1 Tax=Moraxella nasovis TaxID=2904121 RepID=UPI001F60CD69|nr:hypothetical protein [Moraxella nasovis]UNU73482.1 hypothetical protein LU293_00770 [Moraxella nasovis]
MLAKNLKNSIIYQGAIGQIIALFLAALLFSCAVVAVIGYKVGFRQGAHNVTAAMKTDGAHLSAEDAAKLRADNNQLRLQVSQITQERDITSTNLYQLQANYDALQAKNAQLQQLNDILKSSAAEHGGIALKILSAHIEPLEGDAYEYRFDVAMVDVNGQAARMIPKLTLLNSTSMVQIPLEPSSYQIDGVAKIQGRFIMPKDFTPQQMKIELVAGDQNLQQLYNWQFGKVKKSP